MKLDLSSLRPQEGEQYQVDAFTDRPFGGNPAAVVFEHRDEEWMQSVAAENNLSETAFVAARTTSSSCAEFDIRWCVVLYI
jgi:PhzF family phenazine biosynthesis protein